MDLAVLDEHKSQRSNSGGTDLSVVIVILEAVEPEMVSRNTDVRAEGAGPMVLPGTLRSLEEIKSWRSATKGSPRRPPGPSY